MFSSGYNVYYLLHKVSQSNVDVWACLVSLFGLSVASFQRCFIFCKITDLASRFFFSFHPFFPTSVLVTLHERCSRLHTAVVQLCAFVDCVGLKYLQRGSCFFPSLPSLWLSSPALLPLFLITFSVVVNFLIHLVFEGARLSLSLSPCWHFTCTALLTGGRLLLG